MVETGKEVLLSDSTTRFISYFPDFKFLYCIPEYPTSLDKLSLGKITFNQVPITYFPFKQYNFQGLSDHTVGIEASMIAMTREATIIEKHFCLKRDNSNPDMVCSIEPNELKELVEFARKVEGVC